MGGDTTYYSSHFRGTEYWDFDEFSSDEVANIIANAAAQMDDVDKEDPTHPTQVAAIARSTVQLIGSTTLRLHVSELLRVQSDKLRLLGHDDVAHQLTTIHHIVNTLVMSSESSYERLQARHQLVVRTAKISIWAWACFALAGWCAYLWVR